MTDVAFNPLGEWRSRTTFVLALATSAVGMGSIWRFSYLSGEYGGAPFVLAYIACLFLLAVPLLVAELVLGRQGRGSVVESVQRAAERSDCSRLWQLLPWAACLTGLLLLACLTVVAGWALVYVRDTFNGTFSAASAVNVGQYFNELLHSGGRMLWWQSLFLGAVVVVVAAGVRRGVGLLGWLWIPALMAGLGLLIQYALQHGDLVAAGRFLFAFQLLDFNGAAWLAALGQAFYTLGIGVATGISYGGYAPIRVPLARSVIAVAVFDTLVAIAVGLAVFPLVFAHNMLPSMGPGLLFVSLPHAFGNMPLGEVYGALFYLLVALVALGSCVAMLEPVVGALRQQFGIRRITAVSVAGATVWVLAFGALATLEAPGSAASGLDLFRLMDRLASSVLLPLVALATAVLVGWRLREVLLRAQLYRESALFFSLWYFLLRYIVPVAIGLLLLTGLWPD